MLDRLITYLTTYVYFQNPAQPLVLALWIIHTQLFGGETPTPYTTPYIYVYSPEKQSGKTRLIDTVEPLVRNPIRGTDMSESTLFRLIESIQPTILLDEVDTVFNGAKHEGLRGLLNGGYKVGGHVWRTDALEPTKFSTFGAKLLAGIDNAALPDTLRDRCLPIQLHRKPREVEMPHFYSYEIEPVAEELRTLISEELSRIDMAALRDHRPKPMTDISDRAWEISMPLVSLAHFLKVETEARAAIHKLVSEQYVSTLSPGAQLLSDIRDVFENEGVAKIHTAELIDKIGRHGWNGKTLGQRLKPFGVESHTIRVGAQTLKGYDKGDFAQAWERYL